MKKIFFTILIALSITAYGQEHEAIFPDLEGTALLDAVTENFTPTISLSYGNARDILFGEVYRVNDSLHCIYTNWAVPMPPGQDPTQVAFQDGAGINTEHTWPQSLGASSGAPKSDMHHLYPSRVDVNQDRASLKFGNIADNVTDRWYYLSSTLTSIPSIDKDNYSEYLQDNSFEPREISKGNIARSIFYFYTIYRSQATSSGAGFFENQQSDLCQWNAEDPVDENEWNRTFLIANHQSNKPNPFIVDCTLADRMYCPNSLDELCLPTANTSVSEQLDVKVFPNPGNNNSRILGFAQAAGLLQVSYFDTQGKKVQSEQLHVGQGAFQLSIDLPYAGFWQCKMSLETDNALFVKVVSVVVVE